MLSWLMIFLLNIYILFSIFRRINQTSSGQTDSTYIKERLLSFLYRSALALGVLLIGRLLGSIGAIIIVISAIYFATHIILIYFHLPQFIALSWLDSHQPVTNLHKEIPSIQHKKTLSEIPVSTKPSLNFANLTSSNIITSLLANYNQLEDLFQLNDVQLITLIEQASEKNLERHNKILKQTHNEEIKEILRKKYMNDSLILEQYLHLKPNQLRQALAQEWHKHQQLKTSTLINQLRDEPPRPERLPQPERIKSEIELLLNNLREQLPYLTTPQIRTLHDLIEVLQYLKKRSHSIAMNQRETLNEAIEILNKNIMFDVRQYLNYPIEQRGKYQSEQKFIPNFWLKAHIEHHTQHLIEETKFVYETELNTFKDHQKFLVQKFSPVQDFELSLKPHRLKASITHPSNYHEK